jgi:hypothetical protein
MPLLLRPPAGFDYPLGVHYSLIIKPCFMLKVPMGFTSQSFIPDFKAENLTDFVASVRFIN